MTNIYIYIIFIFIYIYIYTYSYIVCVFIYIYIYYLYQRIRECSPQIIPWGEKGRPTRSSLLIGPPTMPGSGCDSLGNEHVTLFSDEKNGGYVRRFNFQSLRLQFDDALGEYQGIIIKLFEKVAFFLQKFVRVSYPFGSVRFTINGSVEW